MLLFITSHLRWPCTLGARSHQAQSLRQRNGCCPSHLAGVGSHDQAIVRSSSPCPVVDKHDWMLSVNCAARAEMLSPSTSDDHHVIPSLDGLRALSVLIVLVAHAGYGSIVPGGLGVTIFFFLSGYLITTLLVKEHERTGGISIVNFYIRRVFRLMPPLLLTLAVAYALTWAGKLPGGISINGFLAQLFYFANYYSIFFDPGNTIPAGTGILWSLAVEEHFYLFYPAIMALLLPSRLRPRTIAILFASTCLATLMWRYYLVHLPNFVAERTYYASDTRIDSIIYGCILALAFNPMSRSARSSGFDGMAFMSRADWSLLAIAILALLATLLFRSAAFRETARYSMQGLALMPIFYYAIRNAGRFPFKFLNTPWIAKLGVYSYAIYLIHYVVIQAVETNAPWLGARKPLMVLTALAISVAYAAAIDRWIDPYFRALRRQFRTRSRLASAKVGSSD
jgi:peptidoglycan/LPS O-acetylase OafA/YrhL